MNWLRVSVHAGVCDVRHRWRAPRACPDHPDVRAWRELRQWRRVSALKHPGQGDREGCRQHHYMSARLTMKHTPPFLSLTGRANMRQALQPAHGEGGAAELLERAVKLHQSRM